MKNYVVYFMAMLTIVLNGCGTTDSEFRDNGTLAAVATSATLTPGMSTVVTSTYTVTTKANVLTSGSNTTFMSSHPAIAIIGTASASTSGAGVASSTVSIPANTVIQAGGIDVTVTATFGSLTSGVIIHINPGIAVAPADHAIVLTVPATANMGASFAVMAALAPAVSGDTIRFSSNHPGVISFAPLSIATNVSGTAKSVATVASSSSASSEIPLNGLDVIVTATDGTVSDVQVVHVNSSLPSTFGIFPLSLNISNVYTAPKTHYPTTKIHVVSPTGSTFSDYSSFSAISEAPFIIDVATVNSQSNDPYAPNAPNAPNGVDETNGTVTLFTPIVKDCPFLEVHTGTVNIEIKNNTPHYTGPTLYYPVTYSLCW
jgi:hypothetical protein